MFNPFKRVPADPSKRFYTPFLRLSDKNISRIYSQSSGDPEVKALYGFDSVVRINSTYLELVDRFYNWRGMWTTAGAFLFCLFFWSVLLYHHLVCHIWQRRLYYLVYSYSNLGDYVTAVPGVIPDDDIRGIFDHLLPDPL
ncbi:hypothetical protein OB912_19755 [Enterobacter kobei]|nr:hypothetical protein [Enterobacter kobei]